MNVISPWEIYWVLQLDSIRMAAGFIAFLGMIILPVAWAFITTEVQEAWAYFAGAMLTTIWISAIALAIFLPSTKTAAAMLIVPKIANNEAIQDEASEIYRLAKSALERAIATDKKPVKTDE